MYLPLLDANITMDVASMSIEHILIVCSFLLVLIAIIFINGFSIRLGDKELNIGGVLRLLARKDEDVLLKENLHKYSEDVDHDVNGHLYDLVDNLNYQIDGIAIKEHCYFTFEKCLSIFKSELEKRVRRNNLKDKLSQNSRENYTANIMSNIESQYGKLQVRVSNLSCGESYADFSIIKDSLQKLLNKFFDNSKTILIDGCRKKIKIYNEYKDRFKTIGARKASCDFPIEKNERYIKDLERN